MKQTPSNGSVLVDHSNQLGNQFQATNFYNDM